MPPTGCLQWRWYTKGQVRIFSNPNTSNMKKILLLFAFFTSLCATAQVKIGDNPTNVNSNAVFELESTNKGVLFPRMALSSTTSASPLSAFVAGMTVYNTTTAGSGTTAVSPGLYYSDGTKWVALGKDWIEDQTLGSIAIFPFASVPSTYLICNGAAVSRTTYAALFAKIGTTYGAGNGTTTFNLPDLRGEFVRGWDNGRGVDTGRVLGSAQAQATARPTTGFTGITNSYTHNHGIGNGATSTNTPGAGAFGLIRQSASAESRTVATVDATSAGTEPDLLTPPRVIPNDTHSHTVTIDGGGDSETRPRNVAMVYAIKAVESIVSGGGSSGGGTGTGTTYSGSQSVTLNGTTFERAALTGDVTAAANSNTTTIAANAVTSAKIADGTIVTADLADNSVTSAKIVDGAVGNADLATGIGGIYKGSGSLSGITAVTMGTNTLAFTSAATTGTSHFTVDGTTLNVNAFNNRVGIGTASPTTPLHVAGDTRFVGNEYVDGAIFLNAPDGNNAGRILTSGEAATDNAIVIESQRGAGKIIFSTNIAGTVAERVRIATNGYVGIGTTAPNAPLQFANAIANRKISLWESVNNDHQFYGFGINSSILRYQVAGTPNDHVFYAGASATTSNELMRIKGTGNVGIGTDIPGAKLTSEVPAQTTKAFGINRNGLEKLFFVPETGAGAYNNLSASGDIGIFFGNSVAGAVSTATSRGLIIAPWTGSSNAGMKITEAGNVGIGTATPTTPLQVNGAVRVGASSQTAAAAGAGAIRYNTTSGQLEYSNGTAWNLVTPPTTGAILKTTIVPASSLTITGDNSATINISFNYTPISSNSTIIVDADADYLISGFCGIGQSEVFVSRLLINSSQRMVKRQRFQAAEYGGSGTRSATMLPISGSLPNTNTTAKNITINMYRESGDDNIDLMGNYFIKVTEIQN